MIQELVFLVISLFVIAGAAGVVFAQRLFHAVLSLALCLLSVAAVYITLGAEFLAVIQVLVYAGGVVVLFLFAVMLTRSDLQLRREPLESFAPVSAVLFGVLVLFYIARTGFVPQGERALAPGDVASVGQVIFSPKAYALPFELVGILLLAAMVGAIYLARRDERW